MSEARTTRISGNTITVFTVVTIIFLPASFMATFLALPVAEYPKIGDSFDLAYPVKWTGRLWPLIFSAGCLADEACGPAVIITVVIGIPFIIFALYVNPIISLLRAVSRPVRRVARSTMARVTKATNSVRASMGLSIIMGVGVAVPLAYLSISPWKFVRVLGRLLHSLARTAFLLAGAVLDVRLWLRVARAYRRRRRQALDEADADPVGAQPWSRRRFVLGSVLALLLRRRRKAAADRDDDDATGMEVSSFKSFAQGVVARPGLGSLNPEPPRSFRRPSGPPTPPSRPPTPGKPEQWVYVESSRRRRRAAAERDNDDVGVFVEGDSDNSFVEAATTAAGQGGLNPEPRYSFRRPSGPPTSPPPPPTPGKRGQWFHFKNRWRRRRRSRSRSDSSLGSRRSGMPVDVYNVQRRRGSAYTIDTAEEKYIFKDDGKGKAPQNESRGVTIEPPAANGAKGGPPKDSSPTSKPARNTDNTADASTAAKAEEDERTAGPSGESGVGRASDRDV